jgi:hypothetical protein
LLFFSTQLFRHQMADVAECEPLPEYDSDKDLKELIGLLNNVQANDQQASDKVDSMHLLIRALENLFVKLKMHCNMDRRTFEGQRLVKELCTAFGEIMNGLLPDEGPAIEAKRRYYASQLQAILCSHSGTRSAVIVAFCEVNLMYIGMIAPLCKDTKRNLTLSRADIARALIKANSILDNLVVETEAQYPEGQAQMLGPADQVPNQPSRRRSRFWSF